MTPWYSATIHDGRFTTLGKLFTLRGKWISADGKSSGREREMFWPPDLGAKMSVEELGGDRIDFARLREVRI